MWLHRYTNYLLRHRWQALVLTFIVSFVPIIGMLSVLFAGLVTLSKGLLEGALFTLAATIPYFVVFYFSGNPEAGLPVLAVWTGISVAVLSNLLTWVFAVMLRRQVTWSVIIQVAALMGVLAISVVHLAWPNIADWWGAQFAQLQGFANEAAKAAGMSNMHALSDEQAEWINVAKQYAGGFVVAAVLVNALVQLALARWWQAAVFGRGTLRRELHNIRFSYTAGVLFVLSLVLSYLGNSVVLDIMPILYTLFGIAGLSLIHYFFRLMHSPTVWFWLAIMYLTIIFAFAICIKLIATLAFLDIWFDLRKRASKSKKL